MKKNQWNKKLKFNKKFTFFKNIKSKYFQVKIVKKIIKQK